MLFKVLRRIMLVLIVAVLVLGIIRVQKYPFGYPIKGEFTQTSYNMDTRGYYLDIDIPNTAIMCYKMDREFKNKEDIINYLKDFQYNEHSDFNCLAYDMGNYKDDNGIVNWDEVRENINEQHILWRKVYYIDYKESSPECNGNKLGITTDGYIYDYRSYGK